MEIGKWKEKQSIFIKKYKYVILIVVIGIILMVIPTQTGSEEKTTTVENTAKTIQENPAKELSDILSQIKGVGKVKVYLTTQEGEKTVYQTNTDHSGGESNASRMETVIISDKNRNETGMVVQINPPVYRGVIIVCQGGDDPVVQYAVISAVSKVTGLGSNRISVLKMK